MDVRALSLLINIIIKYYYTLDFGDLFFPFCFSSGVQEHQPTTYSSVMVVAARPPAALFTPPCLLNAFLIVVLIITGDCLYRMAEKVPKDFLPLYSFGRP